MADELHRLVTGTENATQIVKPNELDFDRTLTLLSKLFDGCKELSKVDKPLTMAKFLDDINAVAVSTQMLMRQKGLVDKVICPNCYQTVEDRSVQGKRGTEVRWKCTSPGCAWNADDYEGTAVVVG